jgi:hypothetical protein
MEANFLPLAPEIISDDILTWAEEDMLLEKVPHLLGWYETGLSGLEEVTSVAHMFGIYFRILKS